MEIAANKFGKSGRNGKPDPLEKVDAEGLAPETFQAMLETAPINIMLADRNGFIIYLNKQSVDTLKTIEDQLPVKVSEIVGGSYDVFHKNPAMQRKLLANDRNLPHKAVISVGTEKLELLATAVYDSKGEYSGPMVSWSVVTEKLVLEEKAARIDSMVENTPVNIMMCDLNFNITYLNPKSRETLKSIEKQLPVSVDKILGGSIDVFHKQPERQRKLLSDPRNLPHRAKIKVGDNILDLLVSAIYDKDKKYIGPMVTWEVVTQRVQLVEALEQTSQQLAAAAEELSSVATEMSKNSQKTSEQSTSAAASSEEVSKGVQTVATNTEEMSSSIKEIARSSSEAAGISKEAMQKAIETNATINQLSESSKEIGNVIKVISSIAQQTNLLALNATIEAARAGDAGKGFAVVANEVKELAKQTAKATEEITSKIGSIQESSKGAVGAIGGISKVIDQINTISMTIASAVEEQTATTNEVARIVQESNKAVEGIAVVVKEVASAARESKVGADQTLSAGRGLAELAAKLKELVQKVQI